MNILLYSKAELEESAGDKSQQTLRLPLSDRRAEHLLKVLKVKVGAEVRIGEIAGGQGVAQVSEIVSDAIYLSFSPGRFFTESPSPLANLKLVVATPRPQSAKKLLRFVAETGISEICFINSARVEQSYFSSQLWQAENLLKELLSGLEQVKCTVLPGVRLEKEMGVADFCRQEELAKLRYKFLAHPLPEANNTQLLREVFQARVKPESEAERGKIILALGPEGGWIEPEVEEFKRYGFNLLSPGPRTYRLETAVSILSAQLMLLEQSAAKP